MKNLLEKLNSFDINERLNSLRKINSQFGENIKKQKLLNMHMHTFFSFNSENYSPSRLVWEAKNRGFYSSGITDFDVIDGMKEFLDAGLILEERVAVGMESRVFFAEYADDYINSPGEPGVFYFMGFGFVKHPKKGSKAEEILKNMREQASQRNIELINRINNKLDDVQLDYNKDVIPLTPSANATERHIISAYYEKVLKEYNSNFELSSQFWAKNLSISLKDVIAKIKTPIAFQEILRSKLMKAGGLGYIQPSKDTFPLLDDAIFMIKESGAIPMSAWLDGSTKGESNPEEQLECLKSKGVLAVNIVPDRNWNIKDLDSKKQKIQLLNEYITSATKLDMPINVGTELNKKGLKFVDDFDSEALKPHWEAFLNGAKVMIGHTVLTNYADFSYASDKVNAIYKNNADKNNFFSSVGALSGLSKKQADILLEAGKDKAYSIIADSAKKNSWNI